MEGDMGGIGWTLLALVLYPIFHIILNGTPDKSSASDRNLYYDSTSNVPAALAGDIWICDLSNRDGTVFKK